MARLRELSTGRGQSAAQQTPASAITPASFVQRTHIRAKCLALRGAPPRPPAAPRDRGGPRVTSQTEPVKAESSRPASATPALHCPHPVHLGRPSSLATIGGGFHSLLPQKGSLGLSAGTPPNWSAIPSNTGSLDANHTDCYNHLFRSQNIIFSLNNWQICSPNKFVKWANKSVTQLSTP